VLRDELSCLKEKLNLRILERDDVDFPVECRNDIGFWGKYIHIGERTRKESAVWALSFNLFLGALRL
jgi:hypothetical protein